jgi:L-methionine (R)-S-oxide reductase
LQERRVNYGGSLKEILFQVLQLKTYRSARELLSKINEVLSARPKMGQHASPLDQAVQILYEGRHYFWIGIYLVVGDSVVRQASRGPVPPCHSFPLGKGNVGTAGQSGLMKVIPDVSADPTYSMCFVETKSEIVAPVKIGQRVLGVIDVESDRLNAFGPKERVLLKEVGKQLARFLQGRGKYLVRKAREAAKPELATPARGPRSASEKPPSRALAAGESR